MFDYKLRTAFNNIEISWRITQIWLSQFYTVFYNWTSCVIRGKIIEYEGWLIPYEKLLSLIEYRGCSIDTKLGQHWTDIYICLYK